MQRINDKPLIREKSLIRAWQNCFQFEDGWKRQSTKGMTHNCWCAKDNGVRAYLVSSCASTMDFARTLADDGLFQELSWVTAITQTRGRGQSGRKWESSIGNLFATIRLPDRAAEAGSILPQAIGLIIAEELKNRMPAPQIKWPNDILIGQQKAGGILVEERQGIILAGIGLNVEAVPGVDNHSGGYKIPACSLFQFGCTADAPQLWQSLVERFNNDLMPILALPDDLKKKVEQVLAFKNESVVLEKGNGESHLVRVLGIDTAGGLVVETSQGERTVTTGRIIPRIMI